MPYSELKPGRLRLEDETTGTAYLFIQKDDEFLWCNAAEDILQVLSCVKIGTLADRPSAGKKGRLYFTTDTKELYYDNGSSWVRVVSGETGLYDADRDTYIEVEKSADEDIIRGYVANTEALKISSAGILTFQKQSVCVAYLSSDQSLTAGSETKVNLDAVTIDVQNEFDSTNHRITVNMAGKYLVIATVTHKPVSSGDRLDVFIRINGASGTWARTVAYTNEQHTIMSAQIFELNEGDYVEMYARNYDSNGTIVGGKTLTYLCVAKIA